MFKQALLANLELASIGLREKFPHASINPEVVIELDGSEIFLDIEDSLAVAIDDTSERPVIVLKVRTY